LGVCARHQHAIVNALIAQSVRSMISTLLLRLCKQADDSIYIRSVTAAALSLTTESLD